jgi:hypothetical protein
LAIAIILTSIALPVRASDNGWRVLAIEEDDIWAPKNTDRHYTHGIRIGATSGEVEDPDYQAPFSWVPNFPQTGDRSRRFELMLGQNIYTPEDLTRLHPDPKDRPYAGWLYTGFGLIQDTNHSQFDRVVLRLGTVGPSSLADTTQISFHTIIDANKPKGWADQIHNEPTVDVFAERKWRALANLMPALGLSVDALPQVSARIGNVYDYIALGGMVRFGRNLQVDYGPPHIDENLGSSLLNPEFSNSNWAWYVFAGSEGRLIGRNLFLDGNTFSTSAHVHKHIAVADMEAGLAILYGHLRFGYTLVRRTQEFSGQNSADEFGSINFGFRASF